MKTVRQDLLSSAVSHEIGIAMSQGWVNVPVAENLADVRGNHVVWHHCGCVKACRIIISGRLSPGLYWQHCLLVPAMSCWVGNLQVVRPYEAVSRWLLLSTPLYCTALY